MTTTTSPSAEAAINDAVRLLEDMIISDAANQVGCSRELAAGVFYARKDAGL